MEIFRRRREESAVAGPDTIVGLLVWTISDWGRTLRFTAILCGVLFVLVVGVTVGVSVVVVATEGIRGIKPRYLLPTGVLGGGSVLTWITIAAWEAIRKKKRRRSSEKTPPATR
jgi:uncharacterized membrane protein (UPF0136 family)